MALSITCTGCQSVYPVSDTLVGKTIRCKKCGTAMPVGVETARPVTAKAIPAKPAARIVDEDDVPVKPTRRRRDDDDDDERPVSKKAKKPGKKSSLPLILGALGVLVLLGGLSAAVFFGGILDSKETPQSMDFDPNKTYAGGTVQQQTQKLASGEATEPTTDTTKGTSTPSTPPDQKTEPKTPTKQPDKTEPAPIVGGGLGQLPSVADLKTSGTGSKSTISPERLMSGQMDRIATNRVAEATVLIVGEGHTGESWTGSGWFGVNEGLVFTNAHVLNMLNAAARPPAKLTIYTYKPDPNAGARYTLARTIPHNKIKILGLDRQNDLAVLQILNEPNLPVPLRVRPSSELVARQGLTVFGFPLTGNLAFIGGLKKENQPEMSIRPTTVTSLRQDGLGRLKYLQIEGGSNQGNSGGPIVDAEGNVSGVVVAGVLNRGQATTIGLAVPTEYVLGLLAGRVAELEYGQPYKKDGKVHIPVTAECLDPFNRLKSIGVGYWIGDKDGEIRSPGPERTGALPADTGFAELELKYKHDKEKPVATGEIVVPELPAGRAYWVQPYYTNALVNKYWGPGRAIKMSGPPVDLETVDLFVRYKPGARRSLTVTSTNDLQEFEEGEGNEGNVRVLQETEIKATETVMPPSEPGAAALLRINYEKITPRIEVDERIEDVKFPREIRDVIEQGIKQVQGFAFVNPVGQIYKRYSDLRGTGQFAPIFKSISDEFMETMQVSSIRLPNAKAQPGFQWKEESNYRLIRLGFDPQVFSLPAPGRPGGVTKPKRRVEEYRYRQEVTYTYQGSRIRAGNREAVIKIEGKISPSAGGVGSGGGSATGFIKGSAFVDLDTGTVLESEVTKEVEIDSSSDGIKKRISGIDKYKLSRGSAVQ